MATQEQLRSALYALLEGAGSSLEISRDDIDGTVHTGLEGTALVLFDTTPGGAGNALRIAYRLEDVIAESCRRVESCECGSETSCYACLRNFRNQRFHEQLSRGDALTLLAALAGTDGA